MSEAMHHALDGESFVEAGHEDGHAKVGPGRARGVRADNVGWTSALIKHGRVGFK
jgi:hypothetical protein